MGKLGKVSADHWLNQYYNSKQKKWVTIDVDGSWSLNETFDPYDIPEGKFDFPANAWLNIRNKKDNPEKNFDKLQKIWNTNKKFRLLKGGLL